jgi:hypothetical protein
MIVMLFAAAVSAPSIEEVRSAIWADVQLNAMIGNGNDRVSWDWVFGEDRQHPPSLTIADLKCSKRKQPYRCEFNLIREASADAPSVEGTIAASLQCTASFKWLDDERHWVVVHSPPPEHRGHTRTSMRCHEFIPNSRNGWKADVSRMALDSLGIDVIDADGNDAVAAKTNGHSALRIRPIEVF